jgi:hypothetical protein
MVRLSPVNLHFQSGTAGVSYVIWKTDGNAVNKPTPIWAAALAPNGTTVVGAEKEVLVGERSTSLLHC